MRRWLKSWSLFDIIKYVEELFFWTPSLNHLCSWTLSGIVGIFGLCREFLGHGAEVHKWFEEKLSLSTCSPLAHLLSSFLLNTFRKRLFLFFDNGPFFATFCLWASWTSMVNEHSYTEALRIVSFLFFFQNLFSKPLVSKIYIIYTFSFLV